MSDTLQVAIILDTARAYDRLIIGGVAQYVRERNATNGGSAWSLYVEEDPSHKLLSLARWRGHGVIANFDDRRVATALRGTGIPVVGVGGGYGWYDAKSGTPYIYTDNAAIGRMGAEHLLACGLPTLAYYGCPSDRISGWSDERAAAFREAAERVGRPCHVFAGGSSDIGQWESLQRQLKAWLAQLPKPVGLMACNDAHARHVLEACHSLGIKVPADVAVLGVDNDPLICELTRPLLSSIDQSARRIGHEAAALLDRMMVNRVPGRKVTKREATTRVVVPPIGVISRMSTDILAGSDKAVEAMLHSLRANPTVRPPIAEVAQRLGISGPSLKKRFRMSVGRSIHEEHRRMRMQRLRAMIVDTDLPLKTIAVRAGFPSLQYMTTFVHRHAGVTPAKLRVMERKRAV